ncbi:methylated-DNA--[protein]-cysteine S-methyltransferase [Cohnella zeiphila]|uniref:Methylated-DNA--protein-cysteine methyltransferase n=1 Tax=Cohnella zeiphila TaxID=2761120 RepID=A0A7X0VZ56_9BACL|nr:methylated-DNA--[protein]-cysteine S-methyltransferase [Cohnella zeiphila]MBB6735666.1 methylated-DNA--[protein]-cysteine S-methyltransferase [Cohnella zeiphila]
MPAQEATIYWDKLVYDAWELHLAATDKGLVFIGSQGAPLAEAEAWANRRMPGSVLVRDAERLAPYARELTEYFRGERDSFELPSDLRGTPFQQAVWSALREIPYGRTTSYSDIAGAIGKPAAVRAVGSAIGANPVLVHVPCHRVVGKNGALTGFRGGLAMKERLLELEREETSG